MKEFLPPRKIFKQEFFDQFDKHLFTVEYSQATMKEYGEFQNKSVMDKLIEIKTLIDPQIFKGIKKWIKKFPKFNIEDVYLNVMANKYKMPQSVFSGLERYSNKKGNKKQAPQMMLSAIYEHFGLTPLDVQDLTLDQYSWIIDGVMFISNTGTTDGKFINEQALIDKEAVKARAEETRKYFEKGSNK